MSAATFSVSFAGPHVSIQDAGRPGLMRFGVPASGPMDRQSFVLANAALGNPAGHPGIEISLGGLSLRCLSGAVTAALTGGGFIAENAGRKLGAWNVNSIKAGETLTIRPGPWGSWCYLAVAGDLQAESWLGSRATHGSSNFGGGKLTANQVLTITNPQTLPHREGPVPCPVWARPRHLLRCTLGPQDRFFDAETLTRFTSARFETTDAFDRMGLRLRGQSLRPQSAVDPVRADFARLGAGCGGCAATVLLSDHQTTGGYPKIATVLGVSDASCNAALKTR